MQHNRVAYKLFTVQVFMWNSTCTVHTLAFYLAAAASLDFIASSFFFRLSVRAHKHYKQSYMENNSLTVPSIAINNTKCQSTVSCKLWTHKLKCDIHKLHSLLLKEMVAFQTLILRNNQTKTHNKCQVQSSRRPRIFK